MVTVGVDDGSLQADSQPQVDGLVWEFVAAWSLVCIHRNELLQWPCHGNSTTISNRVTTTTIHSPDSVTCTDRRTRTTYGDRCFAVASPRVRNSLPTELRQSRTV